MAGKTGRGKKNYGGATVASLVTEKSFLEKATNNPEEKKRIAKVAAEKVPVGATVLLDSGSTVLEVARQLLSRTDIDVFTNSLQVAQLFADRKRSVCMLGGMIRISSYAATGMWATEMLAQIHADVAILGTSGFEGSDGPCVESEVECHVKRAMIRAAKTVILATDSTKSRCRAKIRFAEWKDITLLVTDRSMEEEKLNRLKTFLEAIAI